DTTAKHSRSDLGDAECVAVADDCHVEIEPVVARTVRTVEADPGHVDVEAESGARLTATRQQVLGGRSRLYGHDVPLGRSHDRPPPAATSVSTTAPRSASR